MRFLLVTLAAVAGFSAAQSTAAAAVELRHDAGKVQAAKDLPQTVVVRVDNRTHRVEVLHSKVRINKASKKAVAKARFTPMDVHGKMRGGQNLWGGWIFSFFNDLFGYPTYNYYGNDYTYSNYYSYPYGNYTYYYYGNPYYDDYYDSYGDGYYDHYYGRYGGGM